MSEKEPIENHAPKSTIGDAVSESIREKMMRQAKKNESAAAAQPGSPDQPEETPASPPVELKPAEIPSTEIKSETRKADEAESRREEMVRKIDAVIAQVEADLKETSSSELDGVLMNLKRARNLAERGDARANQVFEDYSSIYQEMKSKSLERSAKSTEGGNDDVEREMLRMLGEADVNPRKPLSPEEEEKIEQEMLRMVDEEMKKAQSSEAGKKTETAETWQEKARELAETAFGVYQNKISEGTDHERAKEEAMGPILLEMDNRARFEALDELDKRIKTLDEEKIETGKITPELIKSVAAKVHEAWRDAVDLGVPPAEAGAVAKATLNELTEGNPELKRLVNQKFKETIKTAEAKKAAGPEDLPVQDNKEETVSGTDLLEQWTKEGVLIPEVAALLGLTLETNIKEFWETTSQELQTYNPEYLAEILMALPPDVAAEFVGHLPDQLQTDVLSRVVAAETSPDEAAKEDAAKYLNEYRKLFPEVISAADKISEEIAAEALKEEAQKPPMVEAEELTPEEISALERINKPEDAEKLPQEIKEKLGLGFSNLGFFVEENKNKFFAGVFEKTSNKLDKQGTLGRFISSLAENFRHDEENAKKKFEATKQGQKQRLSNAGYLTGNIMKYGRVAADFAGWTIASPLRYVTLSAMLFGRGAEAAKEARLKNEELIKKNRLDVQAATKEAWKIYEMAQAKVGDEEVTEEELKKAYLKNLPEDIENRLLSKYADPEEKIKFTTSVARAVLESSIDFTTNRLQNKFYKIEEDKNLSIQEKEQEKEKLLNKYSKKLHDYDRMVSQYGTVDALAMGARYAEKISKGIVYGVMFESAYIGLTKLWENLSGVLGEKPDVHLAVTVPHHEAIDKFDQLTGVKPKSDHITSFEYRRIMETATALKEKQTPQDNSAAEALLKHYENMKVGRTGKTLGEIKEAGERMPGHVETEPEPSRPAPKNISSEEVTPRGSGKIKPGGGKTGEDVGGIKGSSVAGAEHVIPESAKSETAGSTGVWEDTIDSSKVATGSDSVWRSTKEIFLWKTPDELKAQGFNVPSTDPQFGAKLDAWAEKQTNVLVEEWSKAHGGKSPDIVHDGDKVAIEFDNGQPHLKIYEAKDNGFEEITEEQAALPKEIKPKTEVNEDELLKKTTDEQLKEILGAPSSKPHIIHPVTGEDLGEDPGVLKHQDVAPFSGTPHEIKPPLEEHVEIQAPPTPTPFETMKSVYEAATGENAPAQKVETIRKYIGAITDNRDYHGPNISGEKLNTLAQLFVSNNEKLNNLDTLDIVTKAVEDFERQINATTSALLRHAFDTETRLTIPVASADGNHVFFVHNLGKGNWTLRRYNQNGAISELVQNPSKRMFDKDNTVFDLKEVASILGYKIK